MSQRACEQPGCTLCIGLLYLEPLLPLPRAWAARPRTIVVCAMLICVYSVWLGLGRPFMNKPEGGSAAIERLPTRAVHGGAAPVCAVLLAPNASMSVVCEFGGPQ